MMVNQLTTLTGTIICLPLLVIAWRARPKPGATPLVGLTFSIGFWNLTQFLAMVSSSYMVSLVFFKLHIIGVTTVVPALLIFLLDFTGRSEYLTRKTIGLLAIEPIVVNLLIWTSGHHDLMTNYVPAGSPAVDQASWVRPTGSGIVSIDPGPMLWIHAAYLWGLAAACLLFAGWLAIRHQGLHRKQLVLVCVAIVVPLISSILDTIIRSVIQLTEPGFIVTSLLLTVALTVFDLVDLTPIARATVLSELSSGIIVLDSDDRVVDINPMGRELLAIGDNSVIGTHARDVFSNTAEIYDRYASTREGEETITVDTERGTRHYLVRISPLYDRRDRYLGRVFLLQDVTDQQERQAKLERQNEQLERFASVVSHDLRNPIQVANSHVQLAKEADNDDQHLERIHQNHERMERIIEDVLAMARQGQTIENTSPTDLAAVADAAWKTVDTADAVFENELTGVVEADESRLQQAFENLFRNAVEHGRSDVTVSAGLLTTNTENDLDLLAQGYFIADDGDGIPADKREQVFEAGHTDSEDGTGLGLSIVKSIIEAHGWSINVTEARTGGARFEVSGVSVTETKTASDDTPAITETVTSPEDDPNTSKQTGEFL